MYYHQIKNLVNNCLTRSLLFLAILLNFIVAVPFSPSALASNPLKGSDLIFQGAFAMPRLIAADEETNSEKGLALRRVNGQVRLFSVAHKLMSYQYPLYEVTVPTLKKSAPWNEAPVVKSWGNVFADKFGQINGLYWDETDKRLYYSSSPNYVGSSDVANDPYFPTLSFLTFNPDETTATSYGRWGFSARGLKQVNFGVTPVPTDFATQYLNGKRLAAGFGGYQSVMSTGDVSLGPSLTAFTPPVIGTQGGYLANTPLVGYGNSYGTWTTGSRPARDRCWRDDNVIHDIYGNLDDPDNSTFSGNPRWFLSGDEKFYWQGYSINGNSRANIPDNKTFPDSAIVTKHWVPGNAFWNNDYLGQAGTWIQTANMEKEGFLLLGSFATGHSWYYLSDSHAEGFQHKWMIYTRDQLASVAQGTVREDQIQPARYTADFSSTGVTTSAFTGVPPYVCTGMVYDPVDNRLYVALQYASNAPIGNMYSTHLVYVYKINDTPAPKNLRIVP
jgi:hypothetical protein